MHKQITTAVIAWVIFFSAAFNASAQATGSIKITGEVTKPLTLSSAQVAAMPHITISMNDRDGKPHSYSGVPIQALLDSAGVTTGKQLRGENLSKYVLVKCADNYQVVFSLAELDSDFADRKAILADAAEGKPLPDGKGPFRFILEGEKKPARACFQVVEISIKFAKE